VLDNRVQLLARTVESGWASKERKDASTIWVGLSEERDRDRMQVLQYYCTYVLFSGENDRECERLQVSGDKQMTVKTSNLPAREPHRIFKVYASAF